MKGSFKRFLLAIGFTLCSAGAFAQSICTDLIAGQSINVGTVCAEKTETTLDITYSTFGEWYLSEAHLGIGLQSTDVTQPDGSALPPGQLDYNAGDIAYVQSYTFSVPLSDLPELSCPDQVFVAAHASVNRISSGEVIQSETAWANGTPFTGSRWGWYWEFTVTCDPDLPSGQRQCETAFAYGDTTFIELGLTKGRWGWEIGPITEGSYSTPLYAGAGRNRINKATYVGDLVYTYLAGVLTVSYEANAGFGFDETHLYANYVEIDTIAPGQFGNIHDGLANASDDSYTLNFDGSDLFMVAHAVACWAE